MIRNKNFGLKQLSVLLLLAMAGSGLAQPGPLQSYEVPIAGGTATVPRYTPLALSYYPYHNGQPNDTIRYILAEQMTPGTVSTADRLIDVTSAGTYGYRLTSGAWTGTLQMMRNGRAFLVMNRHEPRSLTLTGLPLDTITYLSPMPNGTATYCAPRMLREHRIDSVGLSRSGFHWSGNMRQGGDIIMDLTTRQIARRDSSGWIGTMTHVRIGQPVMIQVNNSWTFDWTYNPSFE